MHEEELFLDEGAVEPIEESPADKKSRKREYAYKAGLLALSIITAVSLYENNKLKHENELLKSESKYNLEKYLNASESPRLVLTKPNFSSAREFDRAIFFKFSKVGDFDDIFVETEAGIYHGKAGKIFKVGLTREEFNDYVDGKPVSFYVTEVNGIKTDKYRGIIK